MSRVPFIAGNWKLNLGPAQARSLATELRSAMGGSIDVTIAVFPTALSVAPVVEVLSDSVIAVGVQDIAAAASGAWTGANSAPMARELGCEYTLVGHSERRQHWGETNASCAQKLVTALEAGLLPILCIGETLEQRRAGQVDAVVHGQLERGLALLEPDQIAALTLAYEPVWAIGTGETASPAQAQAVHASIRRWLRQRVGVVADSIRIQYGGSVKPTNAVELMACPDIDGALVGGASLESESFSGIVAAAT